MDKKLKSKKIALQDKNNDIKDILTGNKDKVNEEIFNLLLEMSEIIQNTAFKSDFDFRYIEAIVSKYTQKIINISTEQIISNFTK